MRRHLLYIINPISGTRNKKNIRQIIEEKTKQAGLPFQVFPSVANGDYSFLRSLINEQKITDIVIAGGDGTVSQVVGSLLNCNVNFGIIPCGSGNGLAFAAKIPKPVEKALEIIFTGNAAGTDGFYVNNQFACMLCGLGFDATVAHQFAQQPGRGLTTYIQQAVKNFFTAKTFRFGIETGGAKFETEAYFISIANSNQYGNNVKIAPKASLSDGLLDVVIVTRQNKMSVLLSTLNQLSGNIALQRTEEITERKSVLYFQAEKIKVHNYDDALLHIDGDPAETAEKLNFEIAKNCFLLIQP